MSTAGRAAADISQIYERNQEATVYVGNLDTKADEELLWEIFTQAGPVKNIHIPRDKITGMHSNYGFVEYHLETDADYALKIMNMVKLYTKPMRCNKAAQDKRTLEVGANLFIGNLDPEVDDSLLFSTFSSFGNLLSAKVMRDPESGEHRGFGFAAYDCFEASDAALAAMNGQFLCDRPIHVSYAYKKDTKGERHGSAAERLLAGNRQHLMKDQQQQHVMANVMTAMMANIIPPAPLSCIPQQTTNHTSFPLLPTPIQQSLIPNPPSSTTLGLHEQSMTNLPPPPPPPESMPIMQHHPQAMYPTRPTLPPGIPPPPFGSPPVVLTPPNMPPPPPM